MPAITPPYFRIPFAENGEVTPIPDDVQPDGSLSFQEGWGEDYQLNRLTDPNAKPIGRRSMNQLFLMLSTVAQQYFEYGVPPFITASQNDGVPFPYPLYARCYYNDNVYENQVADNTATPGVDNSWIRISASADGVQAGVVLDFAGPIAPAGYLLCDGGAYSRVTYQRLFDAVTQVQNATTTATTNTITGLTGALKMRVGSAVESANFPAGTTLSTIIDDTSITVSNPATASGLVDVRIFSWGSGDGSTTFNIPGLGGNTTIGSGGPTSTVPFAVQGNKLADSGGQIAHTMALNELVSHSHIQVLTGAPGDGVQPGPGLGSGSAATQTSTTGGGQPFNVMQPSVVMNKIIKT